MSHFVSEPNFQKNKQMFLYIKIRILYDDMTQNKQKYNRNILKHKADTRTFNRRQHIP